MSTATMVTGTCECGTAVQREHADGFGAQILNGLPFLCPRCSIERQAAWDAEASAEQDRADAERLASKLEALPVALRHASLNELDTDGRATALDAARRWAAGDLKGLVLLGPIGVGKTTIAAATVREYIANNLHKPAPRWVNTVQALNDLSRGFADSRRTDAMDALDGKHAALVLDDIDKAKPNANAAAQVFGAIEACLTHQRALIVTTNLMPTQLAAYWPKPHGDTIASRLAGYCELHKITGRDRRWQR